MGGTPAGAINRERSESGSTGPTERATRRVSHVGPGAKPTPGPTR
jgi:hypothetical protein